AHHGSRPEDKEDLSRHCRRHRRSRQKDQQGRRAFLPQPLLPGHVYGPHVCAEVVTEPPSWRKSMNTLMKCAATALKVMSLRAFAQVPAGYPADYGKIVDGAKKEGKVVVYSTTDAKLVTPLIKDFEAAFPGVKVEYTDLNSTEVYNRFVSESAAKAASADVTWSSSMDLQIKLAHDGLAQAYKSPEAAALPDWAKYKDTVYATTFEPIAIVYNKRLVPAEDVPKTKEDLHK